MTMAALAGSQASPQSGLASLPRPPPSSIPPPSSSFHFSNRDTFLFRSLRAFFCTLVSSSCQLHCRLFTSLRIYGSHPLYLSLLSPSSSARCSQPLLTLSNHESTIDDPYVLSAITPLRFLCSPSLCRWSWCAADVCFTSAALALPFRFGKVFPVHRGAGLRQSGVDEALRHVYDGEWLHLFPEGKCWPEAGLQRLKWGVGRILSESYRAYEQRPIVVPIVHSGMSRIMPLQRKWLPPRTGQTLRVLIGEPIHFDDLVQLHQQLQRQNEVWSELYPFADEVLYAAITNRVQERMKNMEKQLEEIQRREEEQEEEQRNKTSSSSSTT